MPKFAIGEPKNPPKGVSFSDKICTFAVEWIINRCEYHNPFTYMDSEPFWSLTDEKGEAYISWEAFYAFSHEKSRLEIKRFLIRSIKSDTISKQYGDRHMDMNWRAAEDMAVLAPVLGFLLAI